MAQLSPSLFLYFLLLLYCRPGGEQKKVYIDSLKNSAHNTQNGEECLYKCCLDKSTFNPIPGGSLTSGRGWGQKHLHYQLAILIQRLKVKCLTFRHFYSKFLAQIDLIKTWHLGMLLAEMPRRFSTTYLNSPDKYFLPKLTEKCLIFITLLHQIPC